MAVVKILANTNTNPRVRVLAGHTYEFVIELNEDMAIELYAYEAKHLVLDLLKAIGVDSEVRDLVEEQS